MKEIAMEFVDIVFVPKVIAKQLALAVVSTDWNGTF
jgi:hypothetical protein